MPPPSPPRRRFSIALRGASLAPPPPALPPPASPSLPALDSLLSSLFPAPPPPYLPPLPVLAARICRAAALAPRPREAVASQLAFLHLAHAPHLLDAIVDAAQQANRDRGHPRDQTADDAGTRAAWNDHAAAVFHAAAVSAGVASVIAAPAPPPPPSPAPASAAAPAASSSTFEPAWLRLRCATLAAVAAGAGLSASEMAFSVLSLLSDARRSDDELQGDLFDAFMGDFDAVSDVLMRRAELVANADAVFADCTQAAQVPVAVTSGAAKVARGVSGRKREKASRTPVTAQVTVRDRRREAMEKEDRRVQRRLVKSGLLTADVVNEEEENSVVPFPDLGGSAYEERQRFFPGVGVDSDSAIGSVDRVGLPRGSTREVGKGYEEIFIPPPKMDARMKSSLVDVSNALSEHPELLTAMKGVTTLNRLQSSVYPAAFKSSENLLVCAPTGAGKTNVALLTIFREIVEVKQREKRAFKVVYVAPMKALAAEVTEKFGKRLGPLGLRVREFTGDMSLSRAEAMETHVLVTTPEKWDVVTRKTGSDLSDSVTLFIVDEIHLLHDERGAVLESIVARTLRLSEAAQRQIRLVGLSATLPNYADVGSFMRVNPQKGLFHFDGSYRPVPLSQTFIGISEGGQSNSSEARRRREGKMHEMAWKKVKDSLQRGHQAMIFVHSRKGTALAAREMLGRAAEDSLEDIFLGGEGKGRGKLPPSKPSKDGGRKESVSVLPTWAAKEISKSKTGDIRDLCSRGVGIHNAGLPRPDRKLVEKLFAEGVIKLLCCTATLAWGVNLPARTVVIMGTEVYDAEKGGFVQLGMLDVMQIFGRAGRPQFDTEGEGTIITMHEHLGKYLSLLTSSIPIESKLGASASRLANHLNAEIVSGTVSSIGEGVRWLSYTYLSVRMPQNPLVYGIDWAEVEEDRGLHSRRATLIEQASKALDDARMCRYDPRTGALTATDLGRVSSHFYVSHETIVLWNDLFTQLPMEPAVTDADWEEVYKTVLHAVSCATEFEQMRSRQEEAEELDNLTREACPIPLKSGSETREGKVAILLQAYISRAYIRMSDLSYVVQSCTRLLRALFEVSLSRGYPSLSLASLELARASESRIWPFQHPLWQFTYSARRGAGLTIQQETVATIEASGEKGALACLREMTKEELSVLVRAPKMALTVIKVARAVPTLAILSATVAPLSRTVLQFEVRLRPNFRWYDNIHGNAEAWWLWVEDFEEDRVYYSQRILLTKMQVRAMNGDQVDPSDDVKSHSLNLTFSVPVFDPPSSRYSLRVESERWHTGGGSTAALLVANMDLPAEENKKTDLLDLRPLSVESSLDAEEATLFQEDFSHFKPLQTQAFHTARHTDDNMLVSAPSGSGKKILAELAILRAIRERPNSTVVYIAPDRDSVLLQRKKWQRLESLVKGRVRVMDSLRSVPSQNALADVRLVLATPAAWSLFSDSWDNSVMRESVSLFVFDDLHLMSNVNCIGVEMLISRIRYGAMNTSGSTGRISRLVSLCEEVPNASEVADWLGVDREKGFFCFSANVRQVPRESQVIGIAGDRYTSRMHSANRSLFSMMQRHSAKKPALIYVSSRRQTLLTAENLVLLASIDGKDKAFVGLQSDTEQSISEALRQTSDHRLRNCLTNGIGLYHEMMTSREQDAVEVLFRKGHIRVMIATFAVARKLSVPCHLVVVKGTETYRPQQRRFEEIPLADILQMIGQVGRPAVDSVCYAIVYVHEPKKTLYKKFLHEKLPIESAIHRNLSDALMKEVSSRRVKSLRDAVEFLSRTFMFWRLKTNPGYYGLKKMKGVKASVPRLERLNQGALYWISEMATSALYSLVEKKSISISDGFISSDMNLET